MQPKNLKTRTWAARVVTYLLYHKCNAEPVNVYTSLLTTYGAVLWQIANIYLYCTVNLQDSAPNNNYYERRKNQTSESTEKNSELQMRFKLWQPSWVHDRTLYHWATGGSRVNILLLYTSTRGLCVSATCSKSAVHYIWLPIGHFRGASSRRFKARLSAKQLTWKLFFILIQIKLLPQERFSI